MREERRPPRSGREGLASRSTLRACLFVALGGFGALALYLIHPVASGFRLPVGPDGPVYTWLARHAAAAGLGDVPGGGPGVPALTLALGALLGTVPLQTVSVLGPVLAAACGLAGASVLEASLGPNPWRAAAGVALTAAFAAYLAGGWLANLAMVAAFLAAAAALALAAASWRPVSLAAALIAAGGLAHGVFLVAAVAILLLAAMAGIGEARRALAAGARPADIAPFREAVAALAGGAAAAAVLGWIATGPQLDVDTSQDGFLRRRGLRALVADRYRERFLGDLWRAAVPVAGGVLLGGAWVTAEGGRTPAERFLRRLVASWAAVTVGGVLLLTATAAGPANRVLQFAFFLPVAAAAGVVTLARGDAVRAWIAGAAVVVLVAASLAGWTRQSPAFRPEELRAVGAASPVIEEVPNGTPIVFVVDTDEPAAAYHVTRAANVIRAGVPAERIDDVHIAVGGAHDHLAGRATPTGDPERDAIARTYASEVARLPEQRVVLVLAAFNPAGYDDALELGEEAAPGVVLLRPRNAVIDDPPPRTARDASTEGSSPAALAVLAAAALALLGVIGAGWAVWGLRLGGPRDALLAAPSIGIGVTILASVAAERVGVLPGTWASVGVVLAVGLAGYAFAFRRR